MTPEIPNSAYATISNLADQLWDAVQGGTWKYEAWRYDYFFDQARRFGWRPPVDRAHDPIHG